MSHLYEVLGITRDADKTQVKSAYRTLAKACHPDLPGGSARRFREVSTAYQTLVNPAKRAAYDARLALERAMARRRFKTAVAMMAASFTLTVSSGMAVAGLLLGV
jgi:curved DNA-binding protein CbpA